ncbi:MAG: 23S rRNA (adenine(2503)-C(2))-methyltransferase RlmN [Firmicutes bacterium]|nr:23S rRNA (adenine(2503)-C(2))-methyltransferase RlmN [Bacillota bacterium]
MSKKNLLGMTTEELKNFVQGLGEKPFRGKQLFKWVNRGVTDFEEMTDFSKALRAKLSTAAYVGSLEILNVQKDTKDGTRKFLFGLEDGNTIESVFMQYKYGNSLCVSSQVGCKMGCRFCATALDGFTRDLTAGEMLEQIYAAERETGKEINHIVVMGMGEPFDNYENLSKFLRLLHDPEGKNMSYRNMTVSTSGIIPAIEKFAIDFPQVNLAISLHRLDDAGRSAIMPVNDAYPVDDLLAAAGRYTEKTGRRITFEYTLIKGENDNNSDVE